MDFEVPVASVPVTGGGAFPVRRIYCVGQNYRAHAIEMGSDPDRQAPFFFQKPADAIVPDGGTMAYPPQTEALEHEVELVVALGGSGTGLIFGYAVGLDMTRRDLQQAARKMGRPWDMAKGFDQSAPCGTITRGTDVPSGAIWLRVNGVERQRSDISKMIWSVPEIIAQLSRYVTVCPGDLIYTGTPEHVGPVQRGDNLVAHMDGLLDLNIFIS